MDSRTKQTLLVILILVAVASLALLTHRIDLPLFGEDETGKPSRFAREGLKLGLDLKGGTEVILEADFSKLGPKDDKDEALKGAMDVIERRVNAYGVTESLVQRMGTERVLVQLPGVTNPDEAIKLIGKTAFLDFREQKLDEKGAVVKDEKGDAVWVPAKAVIDGQEYQLTGQYLKQNAFVDLTTGSVQPLVHLEWTSLGANINKQVTGRMIGKPLGIFLDDVLISYPIVKSQIEANEVIEGLTIQEARNLSIQLNAGRLPLPLNIIKQQDVDAFLGQDSLKKSLLAGEIGLAIVLLFMLIYYKLPGLVACVALIIYGILVLALFKMFPITLTLAGIAAFIISIGMAVDANVLIFERMREELRDGKTLGAAVEAGFNRAWTSVRDSNFSSLIASGILYWFGNILGASAVKGFAVTLFIGVAISMFSAVFISRSLLRFVLNTSIGKNHKLYT